jgi:hypothetical protein
MATSVEQKHFTRNEVGQPVSIESNGANGTWTLQTASYLPDFRLATLSQPGRGITSFTYA